MKTQEYVTGGSEILQEIMYNDPNSNTGGSYSGYDQLSTTVDSPISAASYSLKQYAFPVAISGLDLLKNSGKEAIISLVKSRTKIAEARMKNAIVTGIYSDGTGNGSKDITGLQAAIADDPTTGTYGSIDRSTWTFWRNVSYDATTDGGAAASASNIQQYMNAVAVQLCRGSEKPTLIVADNNYYQFYLNSLQVIQRIMDTKGAGSGFTNLMYYGAGTDCPVVLDGGNYDSTDTGCPTNHMYFINTNGMMWRPHRDRNFTSLENVQSINQDASVQHFVWAGNLTTSCSRDQGVLKD